MNLHAFGQWRSTHLVSCPKVLSTYAFSISLGVAVSSHLNHLSLSLSFSLSLCLWLCLSLSVFLLPSAYFFFSLLIYQPLNIMVTYLFVCLFIYLFLLFPPTHSPPPTVQPGDSVAHTCIHNFSAIVVLHFKFMFLIHVLLKTNGHHEKWPMDIHSLIYFCGFWAFILGLYLQHMEVPRLGVKLELQLPANITATAIQDPSRVCDLQQ